MTQLVKALGILRAQGFSQLCRRSRNRVVRTALTIARTYIQEIRWQCIFAYGWFCPPVHIAPEESPLVSIVIPVAGHVKYTAACLASIAANTGRSIPFEVIVVDDASTDDTASYLKTCSGLRVIRHKDSLGFGASANDGARASLGRLIHFLNNDTLVSKGWLEPLVRTFAQHSRVGAAGSKLCYIDRTVAEAGGIVWRDGNASNYGRGSRASLSDYEYVREVDYCSAASLMVSGSAFRQVGGFDTRYSPAYYEDVDLCFALRSTNMRVLYQPTSLVVHFEGGTAGKNPSRGIKRFQSTHRATFAERWSTELAGLYEPSPTLVELAARRLQGPPIVFIDGVVPFYDKDAGSARALALLHILRALGHHVIFVGEDGHGHEPYCSALRQSGIEVRLHAGDASKALKNLPEMPQLAWICRPTLASKYMPLMRQLQIPVIYDTVDLHYLRMQRAERYEQRSQPWQEMRETELLAARQAATVVATSSSDAVELSNAGIKATVIPIIVASRQTPTPGFDLRRGLLFVGNYSHAPNVDAAKWLCDRIMPIIWKVLPELTLTLAGADLNREISSRASERIIAHGYVSDIQPLFDEARAFVAPLRYGAGMKGKVLQSLSNGLPIVTTTIGAEGIGLKDGVDACIEDTPAEFANAVIRLYRDGPYWAAMAAAGQTVAKRYTPEAVGPDVARCLIETRHATVA